MLYDFIDKSPKQKSCDMLPEVNSVNGDLESIIESLLLAGFDFNGHQTSVLKQSNRGSELV